MKQFVTFRLDEQYFAIEILYVRELNQILDVTPVQRAPEFIHGLINLRGQIVTVFDVGIRLGLGARKHSGTAYNIILKTNGELIAVRNHEGRTDLMSSDDSAGLLIDAFGDVIEVEDDEIEPAPANIGDLQGKFISGVVKAGHKLFAILDVRGLISVDQAA